MKYFLIFLFAGLSVSSASLAQSQPAFRIITFAGEVTLDKAPIVFDQRVTNNSKKLKIKKGGYVGILTSQGVINKLDEGTYEVAKLIDSQWFPYWTVPHASQIKPHVSDPRLVGDSIVLRWPKRAGEIFPIRITNGWGEPILDTVVHSNEIMMNVRMLLGREGGFVLNMKLKPSPHDEIRVVRRITPEQLQQLNHDLARIENHPHKKGLTIAILKLNELDYDVAIRLMQLRSSIQVDLPDDLKKFVEYMNEELNPK